MKVTQLPKYHVNRKKWEEARKARGLPSDEAALDALKQRTIGRVCSSKDFTQNELDRMLGAFAAAAEPGNFEEQMRLQEQPEKRAWRSKWRIDIFKLHLGLDTGRENAYLGGIASKRFGRQDWYHFNDVEMAEFEGILVRRLLQLHPKERVDQVQNEAAENVVRMEEFLNRPKGGAVKSDLPF